MKEFSESMYRIVREHDGVVCNSFNDQLIAVFGAFDQNNGALDQAAAKSVTCALKMHEKLRGINTLREMASATAMSENHHSDMGNLELGIGIAAGCALVGDLRGNLSGNDFNFTVLGSPVSFVLMEQLRSIGGQTLIDRRTKDYLSSELLAQMHISLKPKRIWLVTGGNQRTVYLVTEQ